MTVYAIDAQGKAWHKEVPASALQQETYREPVVQRVSCAFTLSASPTIPSYTYREWKFYGCTYAGMPILVDTAGPWEVKEVCARDICPSHPQVIEESESKVRQCVNAFLRDREFRPIDTKQTVHEFSLSKALKEVQYRMLVVIRKS